MVSRLCKRMGPAGHRDRAGERRLVGWRTRAFKGGAEELHEQVAALTRSQVDRDQGHAVDRELRNFYRRAIGR